MFKPLFRPIWTAAFCLNRQDAKFTKKVGEKQMSTSTCPECAASVTIPANAMQNELLPCPDCGTELEIISLNPVTLERAPEVEEDWGE